MQVKHKKSHLECAMQYMAECLDIIIVGLCEKEKIDAKIIISVVNCIKNMTNKIELIELCDEWINTISMPCKIKSSDICLLKGIRDGAL